MRRLTGIVGLEVGGDDYITKPFSPRELAARVKAQFRRQDALASPAVESVEFGPLQMNLAERTATVRGAPLSLTRTEFGLAGHARPAPRARAGSGRTRKWCLPRPSRGQRPHHQTATCAACAPSCGRWEPDLIQTVHGVGFRARPSMIRVRPADGHSRRQPVRAGAAAGGDSGAPSLRKLAGAADRIGTDRPSGVGCGERSGLATARRPARHGRQALRLNRIFGGAGPRRVAGA